jgi:anaerobic nitric oxide reductase flavorubredoxin
MNITKVAEGVTRLTANLENILFEGFWEIPNGVSLNSYVIKGEKTAIIDGVLAFSDLSKAYLTALGKLDVSLDTVDYIIINHMEPDHSGWINTLKSINKDAKIICGQKSAVLLNSFCSITKNVEIIKDGDTLDLGAGRVLTFKEIPNVHWPDTIATFDTLSGTLFSCDAFGSYGKVTNKGYDNLLLEKELEFYEHEAIRYYSNIMAAFSPAVEKAIEKCSDLPINIIAPGHGIVWRENPKRIIDDYKRYVSYQKGPCKNHITILIGSMYGMTKQGVDHAIEFLKDEDVTIHLHNVSEESWGTILASVWKSTGIIVAMPTYEYKMYPPMASLLEEISKKKVQNRKAFRIGSYGWSGGAQKELNEIMTKYNTGWEFIEPVEYMGCPTNEDLKAIKKGVKQLVKKVKDAVK